MPARTPARRDKSEAEVRIARVTRVGTRTLGDCARLLCNYRSARTKEATFGPWEAYSVCDLDSVPQQTGAPYVSAKLASKAPRVSQ